MLSRRYVGSDARDDGKFSFYAEARLGALDSIGDQPIKEVVRLIEVPP